MRASAPGIRTGVGAEVGALVGAGDGLGVGAGVGFCHDNTWAYTAGQVSLYNMPLLLHGWKSTHKSAMTILYTI